jgi:uncharacterized protein (DUF4415 family)
MATKGMPMTRAAYNRQVERERLLSDLQRIEEHRTLVQMMSDLPTEWHTVGWDIDARPPKTKVTLYLEKSVAAFFREMGVGYQDRINRILAIYMRMCVQGWMETEAALKLRSQERDAFIKESEANIAAEKAAAEEAARSGVPEL